MRDVKGAEVGKHGTVMGVSVNLVIVDCKLREHGAPVLAQMWDRIARAVVEPPSEASAATGDQ